MEKHYPGALNVMIEVIGGQLAVSASYTESALVDIPYSVEEERNSQGYYKLIYNEEKILGFQMIGNVQGSGAVIAWIKKGPTPQSILEILKDPQSLRSAPWLRIREKGFPERIN